MEEDIPNGREGRGIGEVKPGDLIHREVEMKGNCC